MHVVVEGEGISILISTEQLVSAIGHVQKRRRVAFGVAVWGLVAGVAPSVGAIGEILSETARCRTQVEEAIAKSKVPGRPIGAQIRFTVPETAMWQIADAILVAKFHAEIGRIFPMCCAHPFTRLWDIAHGGGLVIEKGRDQRGGSAVAQLKIRTFTMPSRSCGVSDGWGLGVCRRLCLRRSSGISWALWCACVVRGRPRTDGCPFGSSDWEPDVRRLPDGGFVCPGCCSRD